MFWPAFILGLVGSLHCVGMCGPLTLLLPSSAYSSPKFVLGRIMYNGGRIITYSLLGATAGFIGEKVGFFISQKTLSIIIGILVLLYVILPFVFKYNVASPRILNKFTSMLKGTFARLFKEKSLLAQLSFGLVNGLLPCGMVYAALASAFLANTWTDSALIMMCFGIGTVPLMLPLSLGAHQLRKLVGANFRKIISISYVILGFWLIYRGFNYNLKSLYTPPGEEVKAECITPSH